MPIRSDPDGWTDPRHVCGLEGEKAAGRFLEGAGWKILDHRFRMGRLEVDLVARKGKLVVFVEVKTRQGLSFGHPIEAVTWRKQQEIARVAQAWIDRHGRDGDTYRFDVIGVIQYPSGARQIDHVTNAFRAGWR